MANRSYLYSLSNQPTSYSDRPETISGLSEWGYCIPFSYYILMSGNPKLCASLISDGFNSEPEGEKTKLYAISSEFDIGFARLKKFYAIFERALAGKAKYLSTEIKEAIDFLEAHRDSYLLLETVELSTMMTDDEEELKASTEMYLSFCQGVGEAVDGLPDDVEKAAFLLQKLSVAGNESFFSAIDLSENYDHKDADCPLGVSEWYEHLYFNLWNRAKFEASNP